MGTGIARFDTRLPKDQKEFFEYASSLGGYRTLTEFVIVSLQAKLMKLSKSTVPLLYQNEIRKSSSMQ